MVIMRPDAKSIPDPIDVDLAQLMRSSTLVNLAGAKPLPSLGLIDDAIRQQGRGINKKQLIPTNLVINGNGTNVALTPDDVEQTIDRRRNAVPELPNENNDPAPRSEIRR